MRTKDGTTIPGAQPKDGDEERNCESNQRPTRASPTPRIPPVPA
jgi:hypothetical protein